MIRRATIAALFAGALFVASTLLGTQVWAADEATHEQATEPTESQTTASPATSRAQDSKGMSAATRVFAADKADASKPAATGSATPLQSKKDVAQASKSAPASDASTSTATQTTAETLAKTPTTKPAETSQSDTNQSDTSQTNGKTSQEKPAAKEHSDAAPNKNTPITAGALPAVGSVPAFGSLPSVRSMAEGQAALTRKAAAEVAAQTGFVSVGKALRVEMVYGQSWPTLVCKYNLTCLMELEPGEEIADTQILADSVRWEAALRYREQPVPQAYIAFKPRPDAEETNFVLVTDRRIYSILLVPDATVHTPILSFSYPDTEAAAMTKRIEEQKRGKQARAAAARATRTAAVQRSGVPTSQGAVPANELDFNYQITGRAPFKPVRIYTDGRRTYIDLPTRYRGEIPVLIASGTKTNAAINVQVGKNGTQIVADKRLTTFALIVGRQRVSVRKER